MKKIALLLIILALSGCVPMVSPGHADFSAPLTGGYYIFRSSAHQITISPPKFGMPEIPAKVVECNYTSQFIIARQQELKRRDPNNPKDSYMEPDPDGFYYWILDVKTPMAHGPLTFDEFTTMRKSLGIPEDLILKDVYEFNQ